MKSFNTIRFVAVSLLALVGSVSVAEASQPGCHRSGVQMPGFRTLRLIGEKTDRCKQNLMVLDASGRWVPVFPGYWQQVRVRVNSNGYWYFRSGPCGTIERRRIRAGTNVEVLQVYWNSRDNGRVWWKAWGY